jgi:hypothetical protein
VRQSFLFRYNAGMALQNVDIESGLVRLAEKRIEEAMRQGKFDNLPGFGKPLDLEPMPANENARLAWWAIRLMRQNDFVPDEVQWRKRIDLLKAAIEKLGDESKLAALVEQANDLVRRLNTLGTNAIQLPIAPLSLDVERNHLRERLARAGLQ